MPGATTFAAGQLVVMDGLKSQPALNGQRAVVRRFVPERGRWEVDTARGSQRTLAVKPANLRPIATAGVWDALEVWPRPASEVAAPAQIPVAPVEDWPTDWTHEVAYLKARGWQDPQLFGFASAEAKKPDFELYYDAADTASTINTLGNLVVAGTPTYKLPHGGLHDIHGKFIVMGSPTMMGDVAGFGQQGFAPHGPDGTRWSVAHVQQVLHFFTNTAAAARKREQMSEPMALMGF